MRGVDRRSAVLGPDAPATLVSLGDLALAYEWLGRTGDAARLARELVERTSPDDEAYAVRRALQRRTAGR